MIVVNTTADEYQGIRGSSELANGYLVVVWNDESQTRSRANRLSIRVQILDANGNRLGGEFVVNTITQGYEQCPTIAALSGGGFMVSWTDDSGRDMIPRTMRSGRRSSRSAMAQRTVR